MAKRTTEKPLAEYDAKRNLAQSPEPAAKVAKKTGRSFCVQKHLASTLHYDFRLEHDGVLLSWAVPKGPSLNPADKRMAVRVEDHPVAYGDFEGVIPSGYGAGVVMLWDRGTWRPEVDDVDAALAAGQLKFSVSGTKLKGSFVLVRTRGFGGRESWLLIKHRDRNAGDGDVTAESPDSVKGTGDHAAILAQSETPRGWAKAPPAAGGEAGALFRDVIAGAEAIRAGRPRPAATARPVAKTRRANPPAKRKVPARPSGKAMFEVTNEAKVLFPKTKFTKGDLIAYYRRVATKMLPHLKGRAATLKRYPDGVGGKVFFERHCNASRPAFVRTVRYKTTGGKTIDYCELADRRALAWAANLAAIEVHVPLALAAEPDVPRAVVFDLDPGAPATLADCAAVALRLKAMLDERGLVSAIKTSGGKGLHVLVPLNTPDATFAATKAFAREIATALEREDPEHVLASTMSRAARPGKVYIDWNQTDRERSTACVFSVRGRDEPTVSWPLDWRDLKPGRSPKPVRADRADLDDPRIAAFAKLMRKRQRLPA